MRTLCVLLGLTMVACLLAWGWLRQPDRERASHLPVGILVGEQEGYLLTPPEFVAQPFIRRIVWSPDGKLAVLFQTALRSETPTLEDAVMRHRVLLWDRRTRRLRVLWESAQTDRDIHPERDFRVAFLGKSPACLFAIRVGNEAIHQKPWKVYVAVSGGRITPLGEYPYVGLLAPPADSIGYLFFPPSDQLTHAVYLPVGTNGALGTPQAVPADVDWSALISFIELGDKLNLWYEDGQRLVVADYRLATVIQESETRVYRTNPAWRLWDLRTNQVSPIDSAQLRYYTAGSATELRTRIVRHTFQGASNHAETVTTWLHEGERATLLASDSALAEVSPQGDAILYVAHGAAFFREIKRINAQQLRDALNQAQREEYLQQAKRIALATMMYVQDFDEMFPPNFGDEGVAEVLMPYIKERGVFEVDGVFAFRYLLDGQSLGSLDSPASTEVGYLEVSGGRIVIFADGHVKWVPNR